jgi:nucleoside-diphosphate-sugar epimerase
MEQDLGFFKNKKILITGGGGYLGSKLAETLLQYDVELFLLDISFNALSEKLIASNSNIRKYNVDIKNKYGLVKACEEAEPDLIFHFCALLDRDRDFKFYDKLYEVNVRGTLNLLESLRFIDYKGLYFASSSEVYGNGSPDPFHEDQLPFPPSPYSLTKLIAENLIHTYSKIYQKPYTILRIFNFFGPGMPENFFLSKLIATLKRDEYFEMTGGEQIRDFLHISELIDAIIAISVSGKSSGETINICSGKAVILKELAMKIACKLKKDHLLKIGVLPYRDNEIWRMVGDNKKLEEFYDSTINVQSGCFEDLLIN